MGGRRALGSVGCGEVAALVVAIAVAVVGCASPLARGEREFADGRYPEAKRTLAALEGESRRRGRRAEYALYRGLTLAALGDVAAAKPWLDEARARESACPGRLSPYDARRLEVALDALEPPASAEADAGAGVDADARADAGAAVRSPPPP
jgi:hypothetical protein